MEQVVGQASLGQPLFVLLQPLEQPIRTGDLSHQASEQAVGRPQQLGLFGVESLRKLGLAALRPELLARKSRLLIRLC